MYTQISDKMEKMLEADARTFLMKLQSDTFEITSGFRKIVYQGGSSGEGLAIGTTVSASVEITMEKTEHLLTGKEFAFYLGMNVDGKEEYIPMGIFKAQKPTTTDWDISLKAYDRMYDAERNYASSLHYPTDTQKVMQEIEKLLGISFVTEITPVSLKKTGDSDVPFAGYTIREAIGYVAGLYGKFAIFNRAGQLEFRWYESEMEIPLKKMFSFERNEQDYEVQKVVGSSDSNTSYTAGSGNHGISYSNPFLTQEIVNQIYSSKHGFSYRGGTITFLGDCRIDPWDMLQCSDLQGNIYKIPAMQITHEIDGGLTTTITAEAEEEDVEDSFSGPATKAMERTFAELLLVNKLVATKASIEYLEANYIKTSELDAVQANIETAVITNLQGKFATIEYIKANYATIGNLSAANAKIDTLEATALTASSAEIVALKTGIADINTLMFGSASGGSLSTEFSNSVVSMIGDAQIKSAMIKDISADKITSGKIYTNQVEIVSRTGNLDIADNTIQIKDGKKVVRVQIGKDASGDYNIYIWDKNGKLMFDPLYGVQEDGIKQAIIRNDMVSDTANISAAKLDISSLFKEINGSTETIKSSKIYVDADKQTLDISFKNMSTTVSEVTTTASSALTTAQGANSTASSALSAASAAARTSNAANSTANTAKTTAETANSTANKAASNASSALSTANTASANATSALNKITTLTETVTTQGTQITTIQGQISSKIWQQDITTAVSSVQIGGRNLCLNSAKHNFATSKTVGTVTTTLVADKDALSGYHTENKTTSATANFYSYPYKECQPGKTYTWSFWGKASVTKSGNIGCERGGQKAVSFTTEWQKYTHTFTANNSQYSAFTFYLGWKNGEILYIRDFKFEEGTKATTWTPAPEDVDSAISVLEGTTETLSTQYTSLNQTLTSLTATVNSNTTAISKKADGSIVTDLQANMTSLTADLSGFKTTVSSTYSTKTELNKASGIVKATYNAGSNTSAYCHLAEIKIKGTYANNPITICIHSRNNGESTVYIRFVNSGGTDPALHSIGKTGANSVYIGKTATSTWQLYIGTSAWDVIEVIDVYSTTHFAIIWKTAGVATCPSGTVAAFQMAAMGEVDYTSGGTSGSNKIPTSGSLYSTTTIANQTAEKFQWIVKSGTSATDFTLTDRVASLLSAKFDIDALTTFKNSASNGTSTVINGGAIKANTITADKIKVDSLQAISAKIGGFTIDNNNIASGTWGTSGSVMMCTGTDGAKSIGGSSSISGWCFTAGTTFGVTKAGALYANNVKVSGDITATSGTIGKLVINGNYLQADSGTSGNVYRMYIQKPTSSTTWCFSTQYGDINSSKVGNFYARADGLVYCTSLTSNGAVSAGGNITTNGSITAAGKLTATGNLELRTSGNASNILLHDDYAKYCYIRYSGARLWFLPATDSGGFELGHSASLDANTGTFYATAWGSNSSRRYKENITELTESVADRLLKIKTYHFDYKKDYGSKDMYGVIAEEVEQVHKNAVLYRNGEPDAVDYTRFIPLLIKKVQMQDKKLKYLENVVAHLIGIVMNPEQVEVEKVRK